MATRYLNDLKIEEGDLQLEVGSNAAPQSYDKIHIGGDGLASSDAAIYIGNRGDGSGYGYRMYYYGTGSGNNNKLIFKSENLGSPVDMLSFTADGNATFSGTITTGSHGTSANWKQAYDNHITGIGVSGTSTKTITLTQRDGGTITTTFTDLEGSGGGIDMTNGSNNRVVTAVDSDTVNGEAGLLFGGSYLEITPGNIATPLQVKRTSASTRQVNLLLSANDGTTTSEGFLGIDSGADLRYGASSNTSTNSLVLTEDNLSFTEGDGIKITGTVPTPTISVNYDTGDADNLILAASTTTSITGASSSYGAYMLVAESNPGIAQGPVNKIRVGDIHLDDWGAAEGTINLGSNRIINLAAPQTATDAVNRTYADTKVSKTGDTMTGDLSFSSSGVTGFGKIHYGVNGTMGQTTSWNPNNNNAGLWIESDSAESGGVFMNGNTFALWSPGDDDVLKIYDEDDLPLGSPKFRITGAGVAIGYTGFSSDNNAKNYTWRALENTASSSNQYYRIASIYGSQSLRFIIELAGRSTSYSDGSFPAFGKIVGQLNNDNNYDIVYYNASATDEVVDEVGQIDVGTTGTDIYVRVGTFAELVATASISDGTITTRSGDNGSTSAPTGYVQVTEYKMWNQGNDGANSGLDADLLDGQQGTYYVNTATTQTIDGNKTFDGQTTFNAGVEFRDPVVFDSDVTLDGIGSMTESTALVMNGANEVGYRTLGSNAFNSTPIPTVNNGTLTVQGTGALGGSGTFTANQSGNTTISISHDDTSSQGSVNNSGNTFIQDVTLDTYGHVTGLTSNTLTIPTVNNGQLTVQGTGALGGSGTFTANQSGNTTISISHDDTSSQSSVDNSNGTVIQDVTLDGYGHVTALGSVNLDSRYYTESESNTRYFRRNAANDVDVRLAASHGRGLRFWDSDSYKIYMSSVATGGSTGGSVAGTATSDYNMYFKMTGGTNRGFVFKNSGTNITQIDSNGHITTSGHYYGRSVNGAYSNIYRMGGIYFTWDSDSYGTNFNHSITSTSNGTYGDDITINSYGNVRINIDSNNNGTDVFQVGSHSTGTGGNTWFTIKDAGGITMNDDGNTVSGTYALAVNQNTTASSMDAFACGENTTASGRQAFAGGYNTTASGAGSFAIGGNSVASGANSFCAGGDGTATNSASTSIGTLNDATGGHSFAAGYNSTASGLVSFAMGSGSTASGAKATAFGEGNNIAGELDFTIGAYNTTSTMSYGNLLMGYDNDISSTSGQKSSLNIIAGTLNHIGTTSIANSDGDLNLVLGSENNVGFYQPSPTTSVLAGAYANRNIVQGEQNNMCGTDSIVVGRYCLSAKGKMQSAIGYGLVTPLGSSTATAPNVNDGNPQFVVGRHNAFDASTGYMHLFAVGNGSGDTSRFNSFNVLSSTTGTARVGIAKNVPAYVLDVTGQARFTGGYTTSDERLKENIQDNTLGLTELKQLRTVSYDWKSGEILGQSIEDIDTNKNCRGLIAQEAELVSADLVETDSSEHAIKSINQGSITAMLIKAVQEQQDIIESLKERIETLENN